MIPVLNRAAPACWSRPGCLPVWSASIAALLAPLPLLIVPAPWAQEMSCQAAGSDGAPFSEVARRNQGCADTSRASNLTGTPATSTQGLATTEAPQRENNLRNPPALSGDWWGVRRDLAEHGVTLQLWATALSQGQWSGAAAGDTAPGGANTSFQSGGRFDLLIDVDTSRLGIGRGGEAHVHLEAENGPVPGFRGGALWPVNTAALLPLTQPGRVEATSIFVRQRWGGTSLTLGKINMIDLLAGDPFFGGWGIDRFMNLAFVAPPTGVVPPVIMGGILTQRIGAVNLTAMVFDPNDQTTRYDLNQLFETGANLSLSASWKGSAWGRPTNLGLNYTFSLSDSVDLRSILLPSELQLRSNRYPDNLSLQFGHTLFPSRVRPGKGIGFYGKVLATQGNPNPISWSFVGGIAGEAMFANRPDDRFGIGIFSTSWSSALRQALSPLQPLGNERGLELFYNYAITPWFMLTADLQVIAPAIRGTPTETVAAVRAKVSF